MFGAKGPMIFPCSEDSKETGSQEESTNNERRLVEGAGYGGLTPEVLSPSIA